MPVVFVTGRPLRWAEELFEHVGDHGARRRLQRRARLGRGRRRTTSCAASIEAETVRPRSRPICAPPCPARRSPSRLARASPSSRRTCERAPRPGRQPAGPARRAARRHRWSSCWRGTRSWSRPDYWDAAEAAVGDPATTTWSVDHGLVEISAAGVTKAADAGAGLRPSWGSTPADVVAFGDMPNDLPMLAWAGTSYAMANAHPTRARGGRPRRAEQRRGRGRRGPGWHLRRCDLL